MLSEEELRIAARHAGAGARLAGRSAFCLLPLADQPLSASRFAAVISASPASTGQPVEA